MKCMSCEAEINPKWKHAIDSNICPFCGQNVMEEKLKELFAQLRLIMDDLQEYSEQLYDWMLSNYNFIKTDSPLLINYVSKDQLKSDSIKSKTHPEENENTKFTVKIQTEQGEQEVVAEKIQSEEKTNSFFKRAEAVKPNIDGFQSAAEKTQRLKSMASQIKKAGAAAITADTSGYISAEMIENADSDAVAEMQSLMSESTTVASALPTSDDDDIPAIVLAMANKNTGKSSSSNAADLLKLQQMQSRVQNSRKNFETGENRGKGGFSRSG